MLFKSYLHVIFELNWLKVLDIFVFYRMSPVWWPSLFGSGPKVNHLEIYEDIVDKNVSRSCAISRDRMQSLRSQDICS